MSTALTQEFRKCSNVKSRANPDVQCPISATHGDYCSRHYKNPRPFHAKTAIVTRTYTRSDHASIKRIQAIWRKKTPMRRYRLQGPAANAIDLAMNQTELYSLESIRSIPTPYFISFADARNCIWAFDIRTISYLCSRSKNIKNPYIHNLLLPLI